MEWYLIAMTAASVISSIFSGFFNRKSSKEAQDAAFQAATNQYNAQVEANNQNLKFYEQNVERNSVKNQMKEYVEAGINPNLANANFVGMPSFQVQATTGKPVYDNSMVQSANGLIANQIKQSMYDMLIKKEQYLQMRENRKLTEKRIFGQGIINEVNHNRYLLSSFDALLSNEFHYSLLNDEGGWNDNFYKILDAYAKSYNDKLFQAGYRNSNLISNTDLIDARKALTEKQKEKLETEMRRLEQLIKEGEFSGSGIMHALKIIKTIFDIF